MLKKPICSSKNRFAVCNQHILWLLWYGARKMELSGSAALWQSQLTCERVMPPCCSLSIKGLIGKPKARSLSPCMSCHWSETSLVSINDLKLCTPRQNLFTVSSYCDR